MLKRRGSNPTLIQSIAPIVLLMGLIGINVWLIEADTLSGGNQLSLILAASVAAVIALGNGIKWEKLIDGIQHATSAVLPAIVILLMIGMLSGMWILSGIIPAMIYYGLDILHPAYFLPAAVVISAIVSVATGSSWSTIATVGVALLGIGQAMGFNEAIVAGAIISGAYFGDKVSPLSDTTNLAAASTHTELYTHIKYLMQTTVPSIVLTLLFFVGITYWIAPETATMSSLTVQEGIAERFVITPWLFLVPVGVMVLIAKRIPAIAALLIGSLAGVVAAFVFQSELLASLCAGGELTFAEGYKLIARGMFTKSEIGASDPAVASLLTSSGMGGMINTVWLILCAMIFAGVLEAGHFLERITRAVIKRVRRPASLVTTASGTAMLFNLTTGDQYMSIVIPGKMFSKSFQKRGIRSEVLSRTLEDSATATSVLIPWNTCGATQAAVLGVATIAYLPFAFFCYISPLMTLLFAWFDIKIRRIDPQE